jgi:hypothetical protein
MEKVLRVLSFLFKNIIEQLLVLKKPNVLLMQVNPALLYQGIPVEISWKISRYLYAYVSCSKGRFFNINNLIVKFETPGKHQIELVVIGLWGRTRKTISIEVLPLHVSNIAIPSFKNNNEITNKTAIKIFNTNNIQGNFTQKEQVTLNINKPVFKIENVDFTRNRLQIETLTNDDFLRIKGAGGEREVMNILLDIDKKYNNFQ